MKYDLSILIPARQEMFISNTVADILKNKRGKTEVIVGLDGAWAEPGIPSHPDVRVVYVSTSRGQRGMTNMLARLSKAKYVAKTDAHCAFDEGFDVKLMDVMQDDWTIVPTMRNLHVFDWKCYECGYRSYQGPTPKKCDQCGKSGRLKRKVIWYPKPSPNSTAFTFDPTLHFQYHNSWKAKQEGDLVETMSLQGSFFMLTREKYWELNICDEAHGSWGQQGVEVALKTWLSGGKVICNRATWYAHMFRTQGGDFSFPYHNPEKAITKAREYSRDIWFNNKFEKQTLPLSWLIDKFAPLHSGSDSWFGWHDEKGKETLDMVDQKGREFHAE